MNRKPEIKKLSNKRAIASISVFKWYGLVLQGGSLCIVHVKYLLHG